MMEKKQDSKSSEKAQPAPQPAKPGLTKMARLAMAGRKKEGQE